MPVVIETFFEVRTKGDGDFDFLIHPPKEDFEEYYDPSSKVSAEAYAKELGGYVVEITYRNL